MQRRLSHWRLVTAAVLAAYGAASCGETKVIDGVEYDTYGLISQDEKKNPDIAYEPIWGNIVWGTILFEMIIPPIYFFGFSMFEPIGKKPEVKGAVPK